MKIIHIAGGGDRGGAKTHILPLCAKLSESNELTLLSMRDGEFPEDARAMGIKTAVFGKRSTLFEIFAAAKFIKREKPDVVHCHGAKANLVGAITKFLYKKSCYATTIHSDYKLDYMHSFWRRQTFGRLNLLSLRFFDYYVSVSDNFKKMLIERGFYADKIMPIYNGLDFSEKAEPFDRGEYLRGLGLDFSGDEIVLGTAARLTPVKDIPTLLRAFEMSYKKNPKLRLIIGGDGDSTDVLKALSCELGIDSAVCFCGWISDVVKFFAACDIDVLCSISESFPYTILEGIRAGCAVISSNVGGVARMIDSGENGFIFEPGDVETFSRYILTLAGDADMRVRFSESLLSRADKLYSIENMANRQNEIYREMLAKKARPKRDGVVICGAYGRGNAGDEAILLAIVSAMRGIEPNMPITIMTRKPIDTAVLHYTRAVYTFNFIKFMSHMRHSTLFINGGGSLIQNITSTRSLMFYLFSIFSAHILGCRVLMYGCGIGHVSGRINSVLEKYIINNFTDAITVRDNVSLAELAALNINKPEITRSADPAFSLEHAPDAQAVKYFEKQGLDPNGDYICFSVRAWKRFEYFDAFSKAAEYAHRKYGLIALFIPIEIPRDIAPTQHTATKVSTPHVVLENPNDVPLFISILKHMKVVCAVRLHTLVFSACAGVPFIAASYDDKVSGFMEYAGLPELSCDLENITDIWMCEQIDRVMAGQYTQKYEALPEKLRADEQINQTVAKRLLNL